MSKPGQTLLIGACLGVLVAILLLVFQARQSHDTLANRSAIEDVIVQYAYRWDAKDAAGFVALFTEDSVIERWVLGELKSRLQGQTALLDYAKASHEGRLADRQTRHHMSSIAFLELTADSALTDNLVLITHQTASDQTPRVVATGIYRNTWRRTDQGWKIAKRVLFTDRVADYQVED